jgi:penicillin-binding protein A
MVAAVEGGSGWRAALSGLTVGGKTGTAQLGEAQAPHAWFIGFAGDGARTVAIAVLVEHAGSGAQVAAPIFAEVANAALRNLGEPVEEIISPP